MNKRKSKIFCVGFGKTGTTSLEAFFRKCGYRLGDQRKGELLIPNWRKRDFKPIIKLAKKGQVFQDAPFSFPYTYILLDHFFPNSKFILSVRDSSEDWYRSLVEFHGKMWSSGDYAPPTKDDLLNAEYCYKGWAYDTIKYLFGTPDEDLYNKDSLIRVYEFHNQAIRKYFSATNKLIEINLNRKEDFGRLCDFIGIRPPSNGFPLKNKT